MLDVPCNGNQEIVKEGIPCTASIKNENGYRIREIEVEKSLDAIGDGFYDDTVTIDGKEYFGYYMPDYFEGQVSCIAFACSLKDSCDAAVSTIIVTFLIVAAILWWRLKRNWFDCGFNQNSTEEFV